MSEALIGQCHCGAVRVTIPAAPDYINDCNCSLCVKHGATWGYFARTAIEVSGGTISGYVHPRMSAPLVRLHFCGNCGCTTHCVAIDDATDWACVNTRLFEPEAMAGVEVRHPDGRGWAR
ncbi:MAG: GFA family protein [Sphingomonas sp.]